MPGKKRKSLRKGEIPKTRPDAERIDPAALHAWTMKRFPKIMARLREYELREEREKPPPETED